LDGDWICFISVGFRLCEGVCIYAPVQIVAGCLVVEFCYLDLALKPGVCSPVCDVAAPAEVPESYLAVLVFTQ